MTTFSATIIGQNPQQLDLDSLIQASHDVASQEWKDAAIQCVWEICTRYETFTSDPVRNLLEKKGIPCKNMSSLGGVMREAAKNNWCEWKGDWETSTRPSSHSRALRKWRSLIYLPY